MRIKRDGLGGSRTGVDFKRKIGPFVTGTVLNSSGTDKNSSEQIGTVLHIGKDRKE